MLSSLLTTELYRAGKLGGSLELVSGSGGGSVELKGFELGALLYCALLVSGGVGDFNLVGTELGSGGAWDLAGAGRLKGVGLRVMRLGFAFAWPPWFSWPWYSWGGDRLCATGCKIPI
jgi:hypothetical protein